MGRRTGSHGTGLRAVLLLPAMAVPSGSATGVDAYATITATGCPSPGSCVAVGYYRTSAGTATNYQPPGRSRDYTERKSFNLVSALRDLRTEATLFAVDIRLPATNNQAERDLRMAKLHKKISGCFQSDDGARHFAVIRSYISTARKHGVDALDALTAPLRGEPWMPPNTT